MEEKRQGQITDLLSEAFGDEYRKYYELQLKVWGKKEPEAMHIAERDGKVAAYLLAATYYGSADGAKYAYLYCVATKERFRGQGVMSALFSETIEDLSRKGFAGAFLVPTNETLVAFYERFGFRKRNTPAYNYTPVDGREYLIPGEAAQIYLEASGEKKTSRGETILPLVAGWMYLPFSDKPLPEDTAPIWPLP